MYNKNLIDLKVVIKDFLSLINNFTNSSNILFQFIYASNHLPHELISIQKQFQALENHGDKRAVLEYIIQNADQFDDPELKSYLEGIFKILPIQSIEQTDATVRSGQEQEEMLNKNFEKVMSYIQNYIGNKLNNVTTNDCLYKAQKIKELQEELQLKSNKQVESLYEILKKQLLSLNYGDLKSVREDLSSKISSLSAKSLDLENLIKLEIEDYKSNLSRLSRARNALKGKTIKLKNAEVERAVIQKKLESNEITNLQKKQLEAKFRECNLEIDFINKFINKRNKQIQELHKIIEEQILKIALFKQKKIICEDCAKFDIKSLFEKNIKEKLIKILLSEKILLEPVTESKEVSALFLEITQSSNFFSLEDSEKNKLNVQLIEEQGICENRGNDSFTKLQESICQSSISMYFRPLYEIDMNSLLNHGIDLDFLGVDVYSSLDNENFNHLNIKENPSSNGEEFTLKDLTITEDRAHSVNNSLTSPNEYGALVYDLCGKLTEEIIEHSIAVGQEKLRIDEEIYNYDMANATSTTEVEGVAQVFEVEIANSTQADLVALSTTDISSVSFRSTLLPTHQGTIERVGDLVKKRIEELAEAKVLAESIIRIFRETKAIDPNSPNPEVRRDNMIKLSNDLPHKLGINK